MKETKKMLEIIETQYREANNNYIKQEQKRNKRQDIKNLIMICSVSVNILILLIMIAYR